MGLFSKKNLLAGPGSGNRRAEGDSLLDEPQAQQDEESGTPPKQAPRPALRNKPSINIPGATEIDAYGNSESMLSRSSSRRGDLEETEEDIEERRLRDLRQAFDLFDADGSGFISAKELADVMRNLGQNPTDEEIKDMVSGIDDNADGQIDFDEFVSLYSGSMNNADDEEFIAWAFDAFDKDKNGKLSSEEVRNIIRSMGDELTEEEVAEIMDRGDQDGDGLLSFQEFTRLIIGD